MTTEQPDKSIKPWHREAAGKVKERLYDFIGETCNVKPPDPWPDDSTEPLAQLIANAEPSPVAVGAERVYGPECERGALRGHSNPRTLTDIIQICEISGPEYYSIRNDVVNAMAQHIRELLAAGASGEKADLYPRCPLCAMRHPPSYLCQTVGVPVPPTQPQEAAEQFKVLLAPCFKCGTRHGIDEPCPSQPLQPAVDVDVFRWEQTGKTRWAIMCADALVETCLHELDAKSKTKLLNVLVNKRLRSAIQEATAGLAGPATELAELREFCRWATFESQTLDGSKERSSRIFKAGYRLYAKYDLDGTEARNKVQLEARKGE